jgi:hypothetical protein
MGRRSSIQNGRLSAIRGLAALGISFPAPARWGMLGERWGGIDIAYAR